MTDRSQLSNMAEQARTEIGTAALDVAADRGYYDGQKIRACETVGITVTLPKPMTSSAKAAGRFGKQDVVYVAAEDVYRCPAGERLIYRYTNEEDGKTLRRYWTTACQTCALKAQCTALREFWARAPPMPSASNRSSKGAGAGRQASKIIARAKGTVTT